MEDCRRSRMPAPFVGYACIICGRWQRWYPGTQAMFRRSTHHTTEGEFLTPQESTHDDCQCSVRSHCTVMESASGFRFGLPLFTMAMNSLNRLLEEGPQLRADLFTHN
ncbi:hypothetical protein, unlikely [Trypanosoma brucei gambiense DAL972]|uniref:Uncharacterized protein n=1 Tax=Trypanosoma brucei gambiense (strain MHOM/CI/86/DAL972) TaxID=679716 RepID=C9ZRD2_TRYB9|nr:hypothetical protein, unlikely [Trypanosoma brucei gambiense DAL972]CBH11962.1 hypothetical protein, unlikely [Trypanosoma brucei gambiense DAL972]|eukprot:XP_011774247.1 hypothetical protein, unlikely [Trypanosoma brucei gambiense DAL972]